MAATALVREERVGLALAVAAHIALVSFLVWRPLGKPVLPPPERMTVTISDEAGLTSTSPEPSAQPAPDVAPELGEPAPPEPEVLPPVPQPPKPEPPKPQPPKPQRIVRPAPPPPRPVSKPVPPRPVPRAQPAPAKPAPPRPTPARPTPARPAPARAQPSRPQAAAPGAQPAAHPSITAGASRVGDDFLKGTPAAQSTGAAHNPPASTFGPSDRASLSGAINRQLQPNWRTPAGADVEKLVTIIAWELNPDGSLKGEPRFVDQKGKTAANQAQQQRHIEQAIRAVQLSVPFKLPPQFYSHWKRLTWQFDRDLSR